MSDNDIIFDAKYRHQVKRIMENRGYEVCSFNHRCDDIYHKPLFYNFEMHVKASVDKLFRSYFENFESRLQEKSGLEREFSLEDFYIYNLAHEMKHYSISGVGLRYLVDHFYLMKKDKDNIDWKYVHQSIDEIGCREFHNLRDELTYKLFSGSKIEFLEAIESRELILYCIYGVHGNLEGQVDNLIQVSGKSVYSYYYRKLFPDMDFYEKFYPIAAKYKILIPSITVLRIIKGILKKFMDGIKSFVKKNKG